MTYKNRITKYHGSEDMDLRDKQRVRTSLRKLGFQIIKFNWFLVGSKDIEDTECYVTQDVTELEIKNKKILARPDVIAIIDKSLLIVEIDGAYHKKDLDNRPIYTELNIPHLIINKEYLEKEHISWEDYIKNNLRFDMSK